MRKLSLRNSIIVTSLLSLLPLVIMGIMLFSASSATSLVGLKIVFIISFILMIAALVFQGMLIVGFVRGSKELVDKLYKVANGDLTVTTKEGMTAELNELNEVTGDIIAKFKEFVSDVQVTSIDVTHLISTVKETASESIKNGHEIARAVENVADGAINQAEDAEVCYNMSTQLVQQMAKVTELNDLMSLKAEHVKEMTDSGKNSITELLDKSKLAEANTTEIIKSIDELHIMASNISNIIEIITEIANQTNLLSLNASIEAARAGDAGRGFAVVASEVKKLADKSLESAENIEKTIIDVQAQVNNTSDKIKATIQTIDQQIESVHKTNNAFIEISDASDELFTQLNYVKQGMSQLEDFKTNLATSIESISAVAAETAASAEEITSLMYTQNNSIDVLGGLSSDLESLFGNVDNKLNNFKFDKLSKSKRTFAIILNGAATYLEDVYDGAINIGNRLGANILSLYERSRNIDRQVEFIKESINQEVDGIALLPLGEGKEQIQPVIAEAVSKGIKVITMDTFFPDCGISQFISTDNYKAGANVGEITSKHLNGKGNILISLTGDQSLNMINRLNGFKDVIAKVNGLKIVDIINESDVSLRAGAIKAKFDEYANIDCIVFLDNDGAKIQNELIEDHNIRVKAIGFDKNDISMKLIEEGKLDAVVAQRQRLWGELAIKRLNDLAAGKEIPDFEDTGTFEINNRNYSIYTK